MSPYLLLSFVLGYFILAFYVVAWVYCSRNSNNDSFFYRQPEFKLVLAAFGMIGTSASVGNICKCAAAWEILATGRNTPMHWDIFR